MQFTELHLDERIIRALAEAGIETCTKVQEETLGPSLKGRDITAQSQTGTGKTIAFLVTAFQRSLRDGGVAGRTLVVAPTRELADQIEKEAKMVGQYLPHRIGCFYGGVGYGEQERLLRDGVDMVIGTPGRLLDYASSGRMDFRTFAIIVIDEADRLFDMGFIPDLRRIMRNALPPTERQTMLFSATLGERVKQLAWEYMNEPVSVEIEPDVVTVREVTQILYHVAKEDKMRVLLGLLDSEKPQRTLVFTNTKHAAEMVAKRLELNGHPGEFIMGDLPQSKRLSLITDMKAGKIPLLVATDVAARGLHIDDVDLVVNYDLPEDRESYVHRIGRTARAGKTGKAVSLVCERYVYGLEGIEKFINMKIPVGQVTPDMMREDASAGMSFGRSDRGTARGPSRGGPRGGSRVGAGRGGGSRESPRGGSRAGAGRGEGSRGGRGEREGARREGGGAGERRPAPRSAGERTARERKPEGAREDRESASAGPSSSRGGQSGGRSEGSGHKRVTRDTPIEERAAHYREKHDRTGERPDRAEGARDGGEKRPRQGGGQRRDTPERPNRPDRPERRDQRERRPATGKAPPPPPPPPAPEPKKSILDRIRGIFGKRKGEPGQPSK